MINLKNKNNIICKKFLCSTLITLLIILGGVKTVSFSSSEPPPSFWGKVFDFASETIKKQMLDATYPIGSIYMSVNDVNPAILFGGVWERWGAGRVPVGVNTTQSEFSSVEQTGGSKYLQAHSHKIKLTNTYVGDSGSFRPFATNNEALSDWKSTTSEGNGDSQNLQPYITCYMWKRIA